MRTINLFLFILLFEIVFLVFCFLILVAERILQPLLARRRKKKEKRLSSLILKTIQDNTPLKNLPHSLKKPVLITHVAARFNTTFQGGAWQECKVLLIGQFVLPKTRKWVHSLFTKKRFLAAKAFSLYSEEKDAANILLLIQDHSFLVQSAAALAGVRTENEKAIHLILTKMQGASYPVLYFRDILLQGSNQVFLFIEKILNSTHSIPLQVSCLHVLAAKNLTVHSPILKEGCHSKDEALRLACLTLHAHNPQTDSEKFLIEALSDTDIEIRKQACYGLQAFASSHTKQLLKKSLSDENWLVRLQAAKSLASMGSSGKQILLNEQSSSSFQVKQVASYVMQLSEGES